MDGRLGYYPVRDNRGTQSTVLTSAPRLTGRLRDYMLVLAADPAEVVNRTYARLVEHEAIYSRVPSSVGQDVLQFLEYCAKLWFNSLGYGLLPSPAEMEILADTGRRRVHQGIPLTSLLRAFRFGGLEVWRSCLAFPEDNEHGMRD